MLPNATAHEDLNNILQMIRLMPEPDAVEDLLGRIAERVEAALEKIAALEADAAEGWERAVAEQDARVQWQRTTIALKAEGEHIVRVSPPLDYEIPPAARMDGAALDGQPIEGPSPESPDPTLTTETT